VVYIARTYENYGLALADLVQEGSVGLMKAVKRFNPEKKVRLISFAVHWIKAEIQEFILRNWKTVRAATTKAKRKLFFNIRKIKQRLGWASEQEIETIAKDLKVKPETVREMEMHLTTPDMHFGTPSEEQDFQELIEVSSATEHHGDPAFALITQDSDAYAHNSIYDALAQLDPRSRDIIIQRRLSEPKSKLKTLAYGYKLSVERVRQLEEDAIEILGGILKTDRALALS
jgi:RNA polymerase sigma-32 factor